MIVQQLKSHNDVENVCLAFEKIRPLVAFHLTKMKEKKVSLSNVYVQRTSSNKFFLGLRRHFCSCSNRVTSIN